MRLRRFLFVYFPLVLAARPVASGEARVDLTAFLIGPVSVGDYRVTRDTNGAGDTRDEVVAAKPTRRGTKVTMESTEPGGETTRSTEIVVPGKTDTLRSVSAQGVVTVFDAPGVRLALEFAPGELRRQRSNGRFSLNGRPTGTARYRGTVTFVGFEAHDTPARSYPETARFDATGTIALAANGHVLRAEHQETGWYAEGIGTVARIESTKTYADGALMDDTGEVSSYLVEGTRNGEPLF